jgi:hypothetical protein
MTTHNNQNLYTVQAGEDLSSQAARFKVITLAGTLFSGTGTGRAAGVNITSARSGEQASYVMNGITKVVAGGAVNTLGFPVAAASGGFMVAASSGGVAFGRALETCASGDLVQVMCDFRIPGFWSGT